MDVARQSVKSSVLLTAGNLVQTIVLVISSLIIARLLGPDGYGAFSLTLTLPILFAIFVDFGALSAVQHNAAYYISRGEISVARRMTKNAIIFTLITGSGLTLLLFFLAPPLSSLVLHRANLTVYVQIASTLVLTQSLFTVVTLAFVGWRSASYSSAMYMMQAASKLILAPSLIVLGFGLLGAVLGHVLSYTLPAAIGTIMIYVLKLRHDSSTSSKESTTSSAPAIPMEYVSSANNASSVNNGNAMSSTFSSFISDVKAITNYGIPAYIGNGVYTFATASFVLFLLSAFVPNLDIGYYQAAYNVAQPVAIVSSSIGFALFAAFSSLDGLRADVRSPLRYAVTYVSLVLMPLILFAIVASNAIVVTFYGSAYAPSSAIFSFLALSYLPGALGLTVFPSFFNGIGKTKLTLVVQMTSAVVIFLLAPAFELLGLGIFGVIYALIAASVVSALIGIYLAKHFANSEIDFAAAARIFFASDISFIAVYILQNSISHSHLAALIFDFIIFFGLYLTLIPLLHTITLEDLGRLKLSTNSLGFMQRPISLVLRYEIYLMRKSGAKERS